jgi:hypothetical protein
LIALKGAMAMQTQTFFKKILMVTAATCTLAACGSGGASYSLLPEDNAFRQTTQTIKGKLDILWMIDNSGSMETSQDALAAAFPDWIDNFDSRGYDYRLAVGATDAFRVNYGGSASLSRFRDGNGSRRSGIFVIDNTALDPRGAFATNARLGINGSGDERAFESIEATLNNTWNPAFLRTDSKLHIVILSDEEDVSHNGSGAVGYTDSSLYPISRYITYLNGKTGGAAGDRYFVHSISVKNQACANALGGRPLGTRYMNLAAATGGKTFSLCDDFATSMADLGNNIQVGVTNTFQLERTPVVSSIEVRLNGATVPQGNPGWTYDSATNSITMHNPYQPQPNDLVNIGYDPATVK